MEDFDFDDTAHPPLVEQEFLLENLCVKKGRTPGGYEPPATRSSAKRWKHIHEQNMMTRLNEMHIIKKQNAQMSKEAAREIIRKIPVELLAKEWLSKEDATVDMRAYLVDHILPTLILGVERLLKEVDEKGLSATNRFEPEFNPINFLAQYLMRNNPRFSNFAEASPYVRGLREVSEEIKQELFTFEDNRLARIKAETRRKRTDREAHEQQIREEKDRRYNELVSQFADWTEFTEKKSVDLSFLQNALRSFTETVEQLPAELQEAAKFSHPLDSTDETGKTLLLKDFTDYISLFVEELPFEVFQLFMDHMKKCAATQKASVDKENRRLVLTNLFLICDYGVLGLLDRSRIMTLFEHFWNMLIVSTDPLGTLRNPHRWPVVEVDEIDDILFDAWYDEPDGGIRDDEIEKQVNLLDVIHAALAKDIEIKAAKDKIAKDTWKNQQLEQKSAGFCNEQITDGEETERVESTRLKNSQRGIEVTDSKHASEEIEITKKNEYEESEECEMLTTEMTSVDIAGKTETLNHEFTISQPEIVADTETVAGTETTAETETSSETERAAAGTETRAETEASSETERAAEKETSAETERAAETETSAETETAAGTETSAETEPKLATETEVESTTETLTANEQDTTLLKGQSKDDKHKDVSSIDSENNEFLTKEIDEKARCSGDNKILHESVDAESPETLSTDNKARTDDNMIVHEAALDEAKEVDNAEKELQVTQDSVKDDLLVKENTGGNIIKELLASQMQILEARARLSGTSSTPGTGTSNADTGVSVDLVTLSEFSETYLNIVQFVQLIETFIGPEADEKVFATLVHYITTGYQDHESEKTEKLLEAHQKAFISKRKAMLNNLFEKWDNDASGFLELDAVTDVMCKFKAGQEVEAIRFAQSELRRQSEYHDNSLSKEEFRQFIHLIMEELSGIDTFDLFVEFLMNSVERSYAERIRGEARKKWIQQIHTAARTSGTSMEPVYKAVFQAIYKDAETHGKEKRISASIAMLETNKLEPSRGELLLRYAACTPEDCQYMLGKPLFKNMKGVSFQAAETGKPVHVPSVANHGNVYFWNYDRSPKDRFGSFVVVPLKDKKKRVFGVLGVDTLIDTMNETIFIGHEIQFFQGIAKAFSIAYHFVERRRKFLRVLENAISWFHRRCPNIKEITVYFVEPSLRVIGDYVLRKMMVKGMKGTAIYISELIRLERKDNFFCKYLFDCIETSLTIVIDVQESRHMACPIRDNNGITVCIIDLNTESLKILPRYEAKDAQRLLRLLQKANRELCYVAQGGEPNCTLELESDPTIRADILFERLMLQELRDNISRLDSMSFGEIKGYFMPPRPIFETLRATIAIFKINQVGEGEYDQWEDLKNCIHLDLVQHICTFDPLATSFLGNADKVERYLRTTFSVCIAEVADHGCIAAQQLFNWVHTCLALLEYICRMKESALLAAGST